MWKLHISTPPFSHELCLCHGIKRQGYMIPWVHSTISHSVRIIWQLTRTKAESNPKAAPPPHVISLVGLHDHSACYTISHTVLRALSEWAIFRILKGHLIFPCYLFFSLAVLLNWRINNKDKWTNFNKIGTEKTKLGAFDRAWCHQYSGNSCMIPLILFAVQGDFFRCTG